MNYVFKMMVFVVVLWVSDLGGAGVANANWSTSDNMVCYRATNENFGYIRWETHPKAKFYIKLAKERGLDCNIGNRTGKFKANNLDEEIINLDDRALLSFSCKDGIWNVLKYKHVIEAKKRRLHCVKDGVAGTFSVFDETTYTKNQNNTITSIDKKIFNYSDYVICIRSEWKQDYLKYKNEVKRRGLDCGVKKNNVTVIATKTKTFTKSKSAISPAELEASKREAETERQKRMELERKLAVLETKQKQGQQRVVTDTRVPLLDITSIKTKGKRGTLTGIAKDNIEVAEVTVDGKPVALSNNGHFKYSTYVPLTGKELKVQVTDIAGLTSSKVIVFKADRVIVDSSISYDSLNPLDKRVKINKNALALIVGVSSYENTKAKAMYADNDAMVFKDYATEKLGIYENRIKMLINDGADYGEILLTTKDWLRRASKAEKSDIYIFFAGHGLASDDGKNMYLLPYDGRPRLLDKTALLRDELFKEIQQSNPRSVTVFLDTCYSGTTRGTDMLIASRPIAIRAIKQSIPDNFTVFSAAAGDQTSKPLEEAKHGMFSYFLMKGMEGDADSNNDNKITARELHAYVEQNVVQQSSGSQTPELQGDKDRVLVQFN